MVASAVEGPKAGPFDQLLDDCRREYEQTQSELREIALLIQQTSAEVDRLVQRNAQVTNRLRQIEATFDTVPREDIREAYTAVRETQQRLFTMRGQLEKLQSDQKNLQRYLTLLQRVLEMGRVQIPESGQPSEAPVDAVPTVVRVIEARERERQRLARRIHDGPAQSLTNLMLQAEICERLFEIDQERARAELSNLKSAVVRTFEEVKDFISTLRPMMLDDLGLVPTLRRYVDAIKERDGLNVTLRITGRERRFANYKEVTIFRVVQDLVSNARSVSEATEVQILVDVDEQRVMVTVEDNGIGFQPDELVEGPIAEEMDLKTLRERIEMLRGQFLVDTEPGKGTRVRVEVPLP